MSYQDRLDNLDQEIARLATLRIARRITEVAATSQNGRISQGKLVSYVSSAYRNVIPEATAEAIKLRLIAPAQWVNPSNGDVVTGYVSTRDTPEPL